MLKKKIIIVVGLLVLVGVFLFMNQDQQTVALPVNPDYKSSALINEDEILSGGVRKDGIPSIDDPNFVSIEKASTLTDENVGVSVTVGKESRFYPYRILVFHEIVNDVIAKQPVTITYCPFCGTGIVFNPVLNGR